MSQNHLLQVRNLVKQYPIKGGFFKKTVATIKAVTSVSLEINSGETLGLVGESGCGKSTLARAIMLLENPTSGKIYFNDDDLASLSGRQLRKKRQSFQMIFQDPFSSLNPRMTVFQLLAEPISNFFPKTSKKDIKKQVYKLMADVGLRPSLASRFPHEFSGGQRQRISIGRALAAKPELIVCDEPVSALDVSIQAQILNLLIDLQKQHNFSYLFISHDLHVVRHISDRIAVMYLGRIVETGPSENIYKNPKHPYTRALLSSIPAFQVGNKKKRTVLPGDVPSAISPPRGCSFHPRCSFAEKRCSRMDSPELRLIEKNHHVACFTV